VNERPTTWSFVPALVIGIGALVTAFLLPSDEHGESSYLSVFFLLLHLLAMFGSAKGSVVFLYRRDASTARGHIWLARICLMIAVLDLGLFVGIYIWMNSLTG